jgi:bifunctional non-homologous end joining protein LigD
VKVGRHEVGISNADKVLFPDAGLTKGDLIDYYAKVATVMIPHVNRHGVSLQRFPDGLGGEGFYQKDASDHFPAWIRTVRFPRREGGHFHAPVVDRAATLVYLANQAVVTFHSYLSRIDDLERPDRLVYDLDPPEGSEDHGPVRRAALDLREVLAALDLPAWVQTTGSKGFHVVVPLERGPDFDETREFARGVARLLARRYPDRYTLEQRRDARQGRVFLDTLRNSYGATSVAPYSVRARPGAPVATPVDWSEVEEGVSPRRWTVASVPNRLAQRDDPWEDLARHGRALAPRVDALRELLDGEKRAGEGT